MSYSHFHFYFLVSYKKYFLCVPARPERFLLRTVVVVVVDIPRARGEGRRRWRWLRAVAS